MFKLKIGPKGGFYMPKKGGKKYISSSGNHLEQLEPLLSCLSKKFSNNPNAMQEFGKKFAYKFCERHAFFCLRNSPRLLTTTVPSVFAAQVYKVCRSNPDICKDAVEIIKKLTKEMCKLK